jgi:hypothetical protein
MKAYATKLIELTELNANEIAKHWSRDVKKNPKTQAYHGLSDDMLIPMAVEFYGRFKEMFMTDQPYEAAQRLFGRYAEEQYERGIPLQDAIYALILMRRHIWLYAEFQAIFITALEHQQAVESLNRTILMFDYAIYVITERYHELMKSEVGKELGSVRKIIRGPYQYLVISALLIASGLLTYYFHAVMGTSVIFTHIFYVPIVLAAIWWRMKGIAVAAALAVLIIVSHFLFLKDVPIAEDFVRGAMFIFVGSVVAGLAEGLTKAESSFEKRTG